MVSGSDMVMVGEFSFFPELVKGFFHQRLPLGNGFEEELEEVECTPENRYCSMYGVSHVLCWNSTQWLLQGRSPA